MTADLPRPFTILGIQQIAVGALNKQALHTLWIELLGATLSGHFSSINENVDEDICIIGVGAQRVEVDLMQTLDTSKTPLVHTPALNHIGLWVDNLNDAVAWLSARGLRFAPDGIRKGAAGYDVCFIHPKANEQFPFSGEGVLIELVQAPPEMVAQIRGSKVK